MASIIDMAISLLVDPSGVKGGLDKATTDITAWTKTISKIPGVDMFRRYEKEIVGMTTALTLNKGVDKTIDGAKMLAQYAMESLNYFRDQAREANGIATRLGVASSSMFALQGAAKGAAFEDIGKWILRYNIAAGDESKASIFKRLGLDQVVIHGDNAVKVMRNLVAAIERFPDDKFKILRDFGFKPDAMMGFLAMAEGGVAGFDKRIKRRQELGLVPSDDELRQVKFLDAAARGRDEVAKAIKMRTGASLMPFSMLYGEATNATSKIAADVLGSDSVTTGIARGLLSTALQAMNLTDIRHHAAVYNEGAALLQEDKERLQGKIKSEMGDPFIRGIQQKSLALNMSEFDAALTMQMNLMREAGLEAKRIDAFAREAREANAPVMAEEIRKGRLEAMASVSPWKAYELQMSKVDEVAKKFNLTLDEQSQLKGLARDKTVEALGAGRTELEQLKERLRLISASGMTDTEKARAVGSAGRFLLALGGEERRLPGATMFGSGAAADLISRFEMGLDKRDVGDQIRQGIDDLNRKQDEANRINGDILSAFQGLGMWN